MEVLRPLVNGAASIARVVPWRHASELVRATWRFAPRPAGPVVVDCGNFKVEVNPRPKNASDTAIYYHRTHEAGLLDVIARAIGPGDVVVDVGAYIGMITLNMARYAGHVHAFEPNPEATQVLRRNLARNQVENVTVHQTALGGQEGQLNLYGHNGNMGANTLHPVSDTSISVPVATLDSFELDPSFIKIDVEGWEAEVLAGAEATIRRSFPMLSVESSKKAAGERQAAATTYQMLRDFGYRVHRLSRGKEVPSRLVPVESVADLPRHDNLICIHPASPR